MEQDQLLEWVAQKDNRAYRQLYKTYYVALKTLANYYVKDDSVSEDLVQEVFISMLESDYEFKQVDEIKYFLYNALKNKCISYFRKQKVRNKYHDEILSSESEVEYFWDQVLKEDVYATLLTAIRSLPPRCSEVMLLSLEGLKLSEIAERMNISLDTVKEYKSSGKKKLLSLLQHQGLRLLITWFWI